MAPPTPTLVNVPMVVSPPGETKQQPLELALQGALGAGGLDAGASELVSRKGQRQQTEHDQAATDDAEDPAQIVRRWRTVPVADPAWPAGPCTLGFGHVFDGSLSWFA